MNTNSSTLITMAIGSGPVSRKCLQLTNAHSLVRRLQTVRLHSSFTFAVKL